MRTVAAAAIPWLIVTAAGGVGLLAACTGEDPNPTFDTPDAGDVRRGDLGEPCYPNGTCNADLSCADGVCATRVSADGGTTRDAGDADSQLPPCSLAPVGAGPACPKGRSPSVSCALGEECCSLFDSVRCETSCAQFVQANDTVYRCTSPSHCATGSCCLVGAVFSENELVCEQTRITSLEQTRCEEQCAGQQRFCATTDECGTGQTCKVASVNMGGTFVYLGVCR